MSSNTTHKRNPLEVMTAQRNRATKDRAEIEAKYNSLMSDIAKAVVVELRTAGYIEVHEVPTTPRKQEP